MALSGRFMGLDVGDAHIGVALSDPLNSSAMPFTTLERRKIDSVVSEILALAVEHTVSMIVVGLPYELDGSLGPQGKKVKSFFSSLVKALTTSPAHTHCSAVLSDERFTSAQAEHTLVGSGLKDKERRKARDKIAAALILEGYMMRALKSQT